MANFDEDIKRITDEVMKDGTVDEIIRKKVIKGFEDAISDAFKWGDLNKAIKNRVNEILVPYIEKYDMAAYIPKLDTVLTDIVNNTTLQDNVKILENFRELMIEPEVKEVTLEDIFEKYKKYVSKNMDTTGRYIDYSDGIEYEPMGVTAQIVEEDKRPGSIFEHAVLELAVDEEDQEDKLNFIIRLSRWEDDREKGYNISYDVTPSIKGMRRLDDFEIYILRLERAGVRILDDVKWLEDDVCSENEPELTYE